MKGFWIFSKAFSASIERIIERICPSVYMLYYVYGFMYVEPSLYPWNKTNLVWSFWCVVEFCLPVFCWESLHLYSLKILVYNSLFWLHLHWVSEWV
jgi:hypothetical protein